MCWRHDISCTLWLALHLEPISQADVMSKINKNWVQVSLDDVAAAFAALGAVEPGCVLSADRMLEAVATLGERMESEELGEALRLLTGKDSPAEALPAELTPLSFAQDILSMQAQEVQ